MEILYNKSDYVNKSLSTMTDDNILGLIVAILLILFAVLVAPKLPSSVTCFINNTYFIIIFMITIILLANKHLAVSLICLIIFFIIINNSPDKDLTPQPTTPQPTNPLPRPLTCMGSFNKLLPINSGSETPKISLNDATTHALSDSMRVNTINGSATPITSDITPSAAAAIISTSPTANNIVAQIKEKFTDYINNLNNNEDMLRNQANTQTHKYISEDLNNSADKLVIARNAVTSINNNDNVSVNKHILTSLVKSDLLSDASSKALQQGDNLTAQQLQQAALAQSNVTNALVQTDVLKSVATHALNNGLVNDSTILLNIADAHLTSSLNMIDYNHHIESALDAFRNGNYELAQQHKLQANSYLKDNITLKDNLRGIPGEHSEILYAEIPSSSNNNSVSPNVPPANSCDVISATNISAWDNYEHASV